MKKLIFRNNLLALFLFVSSVALAAGTIIPNGVTTDKVNVDNIQLDGNTVSTTNTNGDLTFDMNGTGSVIYTDLTASAVLSLDASKKLVSGNTLTGLTLTSPAINGSNFVFGTATNTNRLRLPTETTTNLSGLTNTAGLLGYDSTLGKPVYNDGTGWSAIGGNFTNPMTTNGDMITQAAGVPARVGIGITGYAWVSNGSAPSWGQITDSGIAAGAAIARSKLAIGTAGVLINDPLFGTMSSESQLASIRGGTGVNNAGSLTYGSNNITLTTTGATSVTLPTSGTLAKTVSESFTTPTIDVEHLTEQGSDPSTPSAGTRKLYAKSTGVYQKDSNGVVSKVGSGSGSGKNYTQDLYDGTSVVGINQYADAAASSPVDGTGGSPGGAAAAIRSSSALRSTGDIKLAKSANNRQGEGWSYDFVVDESDRVGAKPISFSATVKTSANYVTGDLKFFVYNKDSAALITPVCFGQTDGTIAKSDTAKQLYCTFTPTSADDDYRLIIHIATTSALAWDFDLIDVKTGVDPPAAAAIITEWVSYTPTVVGFASISGTNVQSRRVGDTLEFRGGFTGVTANASTMTITLGYNGTSGNVTTASTVLANSICGTAGQAFSSTTFFGEYILCQPSVTTVNVSVQASTVNAVTAATGSNVGGTSFTFNGSVKISGWTSGDVISSSALNLQTPAPTTFTSSVKTPAATSQYHALTGNSTPVTTGIWDIQCSAAFENNGTTPAYTASGVGIYGANGADSGVAPSTTITGATYLTAGLLGLNDYAEGSASTTMRRSTPISRISCTAATCTFYCVTQAAMSTAANARITVYGNARKVPDFTLYSSYPTVPTVQKFLSGSGTYTTAPGARYIRVRMVGGGGGGGGSGTGSGGVGGTGGTTTFGTSLLTAVGGAGGTATAGSGGGLGGAVTINSPALDFGSFAGAQGGGNSNNVGYTTGYAWGGMGAGTPFNGGGPNGAANTTGTAALANSGAGGGGASTSGTAASNAGGGGGAGGNINAVIYNPSATYLYTVGAAGTAGTAGTSGYAGGAGGSGIIIVEEYY